MTVVKTTYKCDICKKEYPSKHYIGGRIAIDHADDEDVFGSHDIEYKEVCDECTHRIAGFVNDLIYCGEDLSNKPVLTMEELEKICDE